MKRAPVTFWIVLLLWIVSGLAPAAAEDVRHEIHFPDLPGYQTLACDLHTHTVFSDGQVWPPVRVAEAWRQGLDALAITDHIEYQPHKDDVPTNHNRPYELAVGASNAHGLLFPRGAEITRDTPPGHFNAIFLTDVNPLDTEELLDAVGVHAGQAVLVTGVQRVEQVEDLRAAGFTQCQRVRPVT